MDSIESDLPVSSIHCAQINAYGHNLLILIICTTVHHVEYYSFVYVALSINKYLSFQSSHPQYLSHISFSGFPQPLLWNCQSLLPYPFTISRSRSCSTAANLGLQLPLTSQTKLTEQETTGLLIQIFLLSLVMHLQRTCKSFMSLRLLFPLLMWS